MCRKEFFERLLFELELDVPEIAHVDFWNENITFIDEDAPWATPALFVEFAPIVWQPNGEEHLGTGSVRLHLVTEWNEGNHEAAFLLSQKVQEVMFRLRGLEFHVARLSETLTNHNHEELLETIDVYTVKFVR